ncbi:MAG: hypothetical protein ACREQ9_06445, partial [Candidatus Binatia bacterium]
MTRFLKSYAEFVVAHAWWVLAASLLFTSLFLFGTTRLEVNLDPEQQLPADDAYVMIDREIRKEFGGSRFVAIALVPRTGGTIWRPEVLQAVHDVTLEILEAPGVVRQNVVSLSSPYVRIPHDRGGVLGVDYLMREVPRAEEDVARLRALYE